MNVVEGRNKKTYIHATVSRKRKDKIHLRLLLVVILSFSSLDNSTTMMTTRTLKGFVTAAPQLSNRGVDTHRSLILSTLPQVLFVSSTILSTVPSISHPRNYHHRRWAINQQSQQQQQLVKEQDQQQEEDESTNKKRWRNMFNKYRGGSQQQQQRRFFTTSGKTTSSSSSKTMDSMDSTASATTADDDDSVISSSDSNKVTSSSSRRWTKTVRQGIGNVISGAGFVSSTLVSLISDRRSFRDRFGEPIRALKNYLKSSGYVGFFFGLLFCFFFVF
jgi:hypothetical protein